MKPSTTRGPAPESSATNAVFETLLRDIVQGVHPRRARLPAERELSRQLGASRPTLREALRRLSDWGLIETRRGSGAVVRDARLWSIEVLPAFVRYRATTNSPAQLKQMLADLLALRRTLLLDLIRLLAPRIKSTSVAPIREAVHRAWEARGTDEFVAEDLNVLRCIAEAADFLPAVWLLNRLADVYLATATSLAAIIPAADDYLTSYERILRALSVGDGELAVSALSEYLDTHDNLLLTALSAEHG